ARNTTTAANGNRMIAEICFMTLLRHSIMPYTRRARIPARTLRISVFRLIPNPEPLTPALLRLRARARFARQRERDVLARVIAAAHGDDDVLPAVGAFVGHRRPADRRGHPDGADLLARELVVGAH